MDLWRAIHTAANLRRGARPPFILPSQYSCVFVKYTSCFLLCLLNFALWYRVRAEKSQKRILFCEKARALVILIKATKRKAFFKILSRKWDFVCTKNVFSFYICIDFLMNGCLVCVQENVLLFIEIIVKFYFMQN